MAFGGEDFRTGLIVWVTRAGKRFPASNMLSTGIRLVSSLPLRKKPDHVEISPCSCWDFNATFSFDISKFGELERSVTFGKAPCIATQPRIGLPNLYQAIFSRKSGFKDGLGLWLC